MGPEPVLTLWSKANLLAQKGIERLLDRAAPGALRISISELQGLPRGWHMSCIGLVHDNEHSDRSTVRASYVEEPPQSQAE